MTPPSDPARIPGDAPDESELGRIAADLGLDIGAQHLAEYRLLIKQGLGGYSRLDELTSPPPTARHYDRDPGYRPDPDENPYHGWAWRCSIKGAPHGPLAGRRVAVKDNISVAGVPMLNGSPIMRGFIPHEDATVVTRLLNAGAEIVGKTAVPAFCADAAGLTGLEPQPSNPYDPTRLPGASSSGNAVVIVSGQADLAVGGDQGGSIRLPAAWSGCVGLKPTYGLVPYTGAFPLERTLDHVGPMAATVADCAAMLEVMAGADGLDPRQQLDLAIGSYTDMLEEDLRGLRVGVLREGFGIPGVSEPDVDAAVLAAAGTLARGGAEVMEVSVPLHSDGLSIWSAIVFQGATELVTRGDAIGANWNGHFDLDLVDFYRRAKPAHPAEFSPTVVFTVLFGTYLTEQCGHRYYVKAQNVARELGRQYAAALETVDVLLLPTAGMKATERRTDGSIAQIVARALGNMHNTAPFDATGNPALSLPCGFSDGLPIGLMLVGRRYDDETVLRVGHAYEQLRGPLAVQPPKVADRR
ncbi:amidase [Microbispora bryophytorum]|uniref:amidase n=1 Tax=Microbispora bryophytorum TaxID=1460882 RepID=UPI0033F37059